jgi:3D (Asp-Asp-Asp) domain-containing protein
MYKLIAILAVALLYPYLSAEGYWVKAVVTAYSPHDAIDSDYHLTKGKDRWHTASMVDVREQAYGVAVPHNGRGKPLVPYGAKIYIPVGYGYLDESRADDRWFPVDDTGGAITRNTSDTRQIHLDLRYRTEYSALRFGRQEIDVYISLD